MSLYIYLSQERKISSPLPHHSSIHNHEPSYLSFIELTIDKTDFFGNKSQVSKNILLNWASKKRGK